MVGPSAGRRHCALGPRLVHPIGQHGEVDAAVRAVLEQTGHLEQFIHGLGHGVGLQIHEEPFFAPNGTATLAAGNAVTIEPGVYLPGKGGVRIEDTLVVRDGKPQHLTTTTRELLAL